MAVGGRARYGSAGMRVATVALSEAPERPASAPTAAADAQGSPEPGQLSEAPSLPPEPPLLTAHGCGFGTGGRVDELEARWSAMLCARELPLEPASRDPSFEPDVHVTTEEAAALPLLREAILRRLGLEAPPTGLHGSHFTRWKLLCMLRARAGDVDKACTP